MVGLTGNPIPVYSPSTCFPNRISALCVSLVCREMAVGFQRNVVFRHPTQFNLSILWIRESRQPRHSPPLALMRQSLIVTAQRPVVFLMINNGWLINSANPSANPSAFWLCTGGPNTILTRNIVSIDCARCCGEDPLIRYLIDETFSRQELGLELPN